MTDTPARYLNRELSWLEFNQRVLDEARNESNALLERLKFLAITGSNLDEFFMVRVGGLKQLLAQGQTKPDPAGMTPRQQLEAVGERIRRMTAEQYETFAELEPQLAEAGIRRLRGADYTERQKELLEQIFENEIATVLTPQAVTSIDDFPLVINQTLNIAVRLAPADASDEPRFAVIPLGRTLNRFITLQSEGGYAYTLLEDVLTYYCDEMFPGMPALECAAFRLTRNADLSVRDDLAADLLVEMEEILDARKESGCVRLEVADTISEELLDFLTKALSVDAADVFRLPGPLDLSSFMRIAGLQGFDHLRDEAWPPQPSPDVDPTRSMFDIIRERDVLLSHPYESFEPIVRLIEEAANDPDVLAIKQILYRTSRDSPIVAALMRAAQRGKHVTVIVELKARFDEQRNIGWAKTLEQEGVQVIYGVKGLKTHAKLCIVVRREPHGIQRYMHFGTGNYNEATARLYGDVSYMTCNDDFGADASSFFNAITGYSQPQQFRKIEAAPLGLRDKILEMIEVETQRKQQGQKAHIAAKLNSLVDPAIIDALYAASQAGVTVKLNIRGICCLRPGVPGLSDNISVISIVDRFLEHARILYFYHGGDERLYISSADWMSRNLDRRVELLTPIEDTACRRKLIGILDTYFRDNTRARRLLPDGGYEMLTPKKNQPPVRSQEALYQQACEAVQQARQSQRTTFQPHRADGQES